MRFTNILESLRDRFSRFLLVSVVIPSSLIHPSGTGQSVSGPILSELALPPHAAISSDTNFGRGPQGAFYFLSPSHPQHLFRLSIEHPMGARDLWRETWTSIVVPLGAKFKVRTAVVGLGHLFLGGERKGGGAIVRSFQLGQSDLDSREGSALTGQVDYFPDDTDVAVRLLFLDEKARILWLSYDSGKVESGQPYLVLHDRILWSDPASYIPLPSETALSSGPPPLLVPHATRPSGEPCFTCRFYLTDRQAPQGDPIPNLPVKAPERLDSAMGLMPAGGGMGLFAGRHSHLCRIPEGGSDFHVTGCRLIARSETPVAGLWWGNSLAYLYPPGMLAGPLKGHWVIASVNPAALYSYVETHDPAHPLHLVRFIEKTGILVALPEGAHPRRRTFSVDGQDLIVFGKSHQYRIVPGS